MDLAVDSNYSNLTFFKQLIFTKKSSLEDSILSLEMEGITQGRIALVEIDKL